MENEEPGLKNNNLKQWPDFIDKYSSTDTGDIVKTFQKINIKKSIQKINLKNQYQKINLKNQFKKSIQKNISKKQFQNRVKVV
ncbi:MULTISPECIES: hypothetical protein [unclassified Methanosarcina]|uniref:hypothetical protein n=1 Tax=unclassified Methanosarcina TaxID=2644672 RepID=UPI000615C42E|nr:MULTISPECIES: hypothetical protein [unclassified Methanosarcina]AKB17958.1 hypothetical protein MSWHS_1095 [Methanosarcina sp. WWM596]AKB21295.1 hypothetical protein MSWH1_1024 [Methanosarcina sp. WH1]